MIWFIFQASTGHSRKSQKYNKIQELFITPYSKMDDNVSLVLYEKNDPLKYCYI